MWGAIIGGLASAAGSIGSSMLNAESTAGANKYNIKLWREQAAYNTPANQMARYREAGLNPNLIYSQGNPGNVSSAPTVQPKQYNFDFAQAVNAMTSMAQLKNIRAQNNNLNAQTDSIKADTSLKSKNTELKEKELQLRAKELDILERTGMRPGIGSAIVGFGDAVARGLTGNNKSPVERAKSVGQAVRNAYEAGLPTLQGYEYSGRGHEMAVKAANKRGLTGKAREEYIRKVEDIYARTH